jgi:hypothetical protein
MQLNKLNIFLAYSTAVVLFLVLSPLNSFAQTFSESQIKGALLYKLTKYIRWETPEKSTNICFIGVKEDQSGETIDKTVSSLIKKDNSTLNVIANVSTKGIKNCHMLFIGAKGLSNLNDIMAALDDKSIVTVSDIDSFSKRGGMFEFYDKDGNLSLKLNYANAKAHNININSALRDLINIVE